MFEYRVTRDAQTGFYHVHTAGAEGYLFRATTEREVGAALHEVERVRVGRRPQARYFVRADGPRETPYRVWDGKDRALVHALASADVATELAAQLNADLPPSRWERLKAWALGFVRRAQAQGVEG